MRILVISVLPPVEVPEADHAYHQCLHLAEAGHEVHILAQKGSVAPLHPRVHLQSVMQYWRWSEVVTIAKAIHRIKPDSILLNYVGHMYGNRPMVTFVATLARSRFFRVPFVTQVTYPTGAETQAIRHRVLHRLVSGLLGQRQPSLFGTLLRDSTCIITLSKNHLIDLVRQEPLVAGKAMLIPPPLIMPLASEDNDERQALRERLGLRSKGVLVVFFGYIYPGKGIETLFKAFSLLCECRDDVKLVLVGGGSAFSPESQEPYMTKLQELIRSLGIEQNVAFTGGFSWDSFDPSRHLRAADIAVLPFDRGVQLNNSSFAAVVTHGLPTITTCGQTVEEPFLHRNNVFLCTSQDAKALAAALGEVIDDDELRNKLHCGALTLAQNCFSWQTSTTHLVSALTSSTTRPLANGVRSNLYQ